MGNQPFDWDNLNLTQENVDMISSRYATKVVIKNYYRKEIVYTGELNNYFSKILGILLKRGEIEKKEYWTKEYLGFEGNGWEHIKQKLYKTHNKYSSQLHLVIDLYIKRKGIFSTDTNRKHGFWAQVLWMIFGMEMTDSLFPAKEGGSTFLRDLGVGFLMGQYFNKKNKEAENEDYEFNDV